MSHSRSSLALLAFLSLTTALTVALSPRPASAQDAPRPISQVVPPPASRSPYALQEVVSEVVWKSEQQGVLLIIAPEKLNRQSKNEYTEDGTYIQPPQAFLPPKSPEGLRISTLENYFPCRAVSCGDVTVLAPAKMHVLNYQNLPKPSAYAGFKPADSFRLLQASLTKAQWQQIAGQGGLGLGDLDPDQRELFLASLPQPLIVQSTVDGKIEKVRVTDAQRSGIRLRMAREMGWWLKLESGGMIGVGRDSQRNKLSVIIRDNYNWEKRQRQAFGAELVTETPAHFKPGHLAFDWEGLDAEVDLRDVKTVGDLVKRAREATRVELYCDPRYARLPVYLRGDGARAGNLLKAVARGVTGTWRRLENAYVLTDDLTGLSVRHARIADWIAQNSALASQVDRKIALSLRKAKPSEHIKYEPDDVLKPSDKLLSKYQQHQADLRKPRKEGDSPPEYDKVWPVSDLPPGAQDEIRKQVKDAGDGRYGQNNRVNPDAVQIHFQSILKWEIPGIGTVPSPHSADVIGVSEEQDRMQAQLTPKVEGKPLPALLKTRALIMKLGKQDTVEKILRAAHRAGFTEVWIETDVTDTALLAAAVQTARRVGLGTRAVVSALRQKHGTVEGGADTNALGETYTQYLDRQLQAGAWPRNPWEYGNDEQKAESVNPAETAARRQRERGDWLDPATPNTETTVARRVEAVAKVPGLDGIILRDLTPPGYTPPPNPMYGMEVANASAQGGFSLARRLAFLRQSGVDPVDLSLSGNNGFNRHYLRFRENNYTQLELPFFPDYGSNAASTTINGVSGTQLGAGNSLDEWNRFRRADAEKALKRIQTRAQEAAGKTPVWYYQNVADSQNYWSTPSYVESRDKPAPAASIEAPTLTPRPGSNFNPFTPPAPARATSSALLLALDFGSMSGGGALTPEQNFLMMSSYLFDPKTTPLKGWDGLVMDMSGETSGWIITLLDALPAPQPAGTPAPKSATKKTARAARP